MSNKNVQLQHMCLNPWDSSCVVNFKGTVKNAMFCCLRTESAKIHSPCPDNSVLHPITGVHLADETIWTDSV